MMSQCIVNRAKNQPSKSHQSLKRRDPGLPTVSCSSVGPSHARPAMLGAQRSTPWIDLTGSQRGPWFCRRLTSVLDELDP